MFDLTGLTVDSHQLGAVTRIGWLGGDQVRIKVVAADEADDPMATPQLESIEKAENAEEEAA